MSLPDEADDARVAQAREGYALPAQQHPPFTPAPVVLVVINHGSGGTQAFADQRCAKAVVPDGEQVGIHPAGDLVCDGKIVDASSRLRSKIQVRRWRLRLIVVCVHAGQHNARDNRLSEID